MNGTQGHCLSGYDQESRFSLRRALALAFQRYRAGRPRRAARGGGGDYCGGITVSSVGNVTFLPGTYVLIGGGMSVSGQSTLNGTGVTFYDTATDNKSFGPISFSGGTTGSLSAPTSGPIKGM